jgi:lambda repressor-like predicted transcriptional regulator
VRGIYVPIDKAVLLELYVDREMSIPQVAKELGTNIRVVHRRLIEHGIPRRHHGARTARFSADHYIRAGDVLTRPFLVDRYRKKKMTVAQIAQETGFDPSTVRGYLHRFDIELRETRYLITDPKQVAKLRQRGLSTKQIAETFGCSIATVERAFRRYGIFPPTRPTLIDRIDPKQLAKLRREGFTVAEIAQWLACSPRTIERAIQRYGIGG